MGGSGNGGLLNDIEILDLDTTTTGLRFHSCTSTLPLKLVGHCVTQFQQHIILTGGEVWEGNVGRRSKQVYQGSISKDRDDVEWRELPPMNAERRSHMAINYLDKYLVVMGGDG